MTSRIYGNALVLAVIVAVAGCASTAPDTSGDSARAQSAPVAAAARQRSRRAPEPGIGSWPENGKDVYCRKEQATGSLTRAREVCISVEEMESRSHQDQALIQDLKSAPSVTQSNAPPP